ncbi:MAG: alpha/beta hydrolase [Oligoflexia bacterium]|nr:alpha/beta hydrolase [Oligoflexia bacterium]
MMILSKEITLSDNTKIYAEIYEKNHQTWLIITHDLGEHCERYHNLIKVLTENYNVLVYDLRDHGKSISSSNKSNLHFQTYISDLEEIIIFLKNNFRMNNFILFGHSIGALITLAYIQQKQFNTSAFYPEKIFVSAPPVSIKRPIGINLFSIDPASPTNSILNKTIKKITSKIINFPFAIPISIDRIINHNKLTHDTFTSEILMTDTLSKKKIDLRLLLSMLDYSRKVFLRPINPQVPLAITVGSNDDFVKVKSIRHYFSAIEKESHLKVIDGAYHNLHNEVYRFRQEYQSYLLNFLKS